MQYPTAKRLCYDAMLGMMTGNTALTKRSLRRLTHDPQALYAAVCGWCGAVGFAAGLGSGYQVEVNVLSPKVTRAEEENVRNAAALVAAVNNRDDASLKVWRSLKPKEQGAVAGLVLSWAVASMVGVGKDRHE